MKLHRALRRRPLIPGEQSPDVIVAAMDEAMRTGLAVALHHTTDLIEAPRAPANPENDHMFECSCRPCSRYWTSAAGSRAFWDWMDRRPRL